jgi:uncharacterized protein YggE
MILCCCQSFAIAHSSVRNDHCHDSPKKSPSSHCENGFAALQVQLQAAGATFRHFGRPRMIVKDDRSGSAEKEPSMPLPNMLPKTSVALATALFLANSPASAQTVPAQVAPARTLNIVGIAEVHAVPDAALVAIGVVTESDTAAAALKANSAALTKVLDAIRSFGVEAKDLQTRGLSLEARYYRPDKPSPTDRPRIIGYTAADEVTVRARDLVKLGDLLDKVTVAGANRIDGIEFVVSNQEGLLDEARRKAVVDAKDRADLYARAAGFALGKVMSLTEESLPLPRPLARAMVASEAAPVPVAAGEMTVSVRVRVVWSLAD